MVYSVEYYYVYREYKIKINDKWKLGIKWKRLAGGIEKKCDMPNFKNNEIISKRKNPRFFAAYLCDTEQIFKKGTIMWASSQRENMDTDICRWFGTTGNRWKRDKCNDSQSRQIFEKKTRSECKKTKMMVFIKYWEKSVRNEWK